MNRLVAVVILWILVNTPDLTRLLSTLLTNNAMTEVKVEADAIESSEIKKCKEGTPLSSKGTKAENKSKMVDWPLREIKEPHDNDVLYGRGGEYPKSDTEEMLGVV